MVLLNGKPINVTIFSDKTSQVWKLPEQILNETNFANVTWKFEHEGEFMHLAQLKALLDANHFKARLQIDYLPYGRQDKIVSNETTFALKPFADLLNSLKFDEVAIFDPHSKIAFRLIENSRNTFFTVRQKVHTALIRISGGEKEVTLCYPDQGACDKYIDQLISFHGDLPIRGHKKRDQKTGYITDYTFSGEPKDKNVLIVDDICDGGMTFKILTEKLLQSGAKEVNLYVSHGLFTKGIKTLKESGINRIFTKDGEVIGEEDGKPIIEHYN